MQSYFPSYNLPQRIEHTKFDTNGLKSPSIRMDGVDGVQGQDFKQVFSGLVENLNTQVNAPDNLMKDMMSGNNNVDIHDVVTAMSKSEIAVSVATQLVGKVITAYERVSQISV